MEWKELSEEDVKGLQFSAGRSGGKSQYKPLLDAVAGGKTIRVDVPEGVTPKALSQRLYTASKNANQKVTIRILSDKTGVVVTKQAEEAPADPPAKKLGKAG